MKLLRRNTREISYSLFDSIEPVRDEYGNETGERRTKYRKAVPLLASVSSSVGTAQTEIFGNLANYDKLIITDDVSCPVDENSVLFVDVPVRYNSSGNPVADYQVRGVARSLNFVAIAASRMEVS